MSEDAMCPPPVAAEQTDKTNVPMPGALKQSTTPPATEDTTIAAIATPPGKGGIAVVRLSGPQALAVAERVFRPADCHKRLAAQPGYTALFGHFYAGGRRCDQTLALVFRAPKSYTGEDVVELSCHGGTAVVRLLLDACLAAGAQMAAAGAFTRRAFLHGKLSLTQAEAVMDLVEAENTQAAAAAAAAMGGALWREVEDIRQQLLGLESHIAAWCDYPEEDVPALETAPLAAALQKLTARLQDLVQSYDRGAQLYRGVPTVIVGAPNVGKSTLLNLLTGQDTAIVTPVAGTTRDVVEQTVQLGSVTLRLADTAGLRDSGDVVEKEGIRRSYARLAAAALVLAVFDASRPLQEEEKALARALAGLPATPPAQEGAGVAPAKVVTPAQEGAAPAAPAAPAYEGASTGAGTVEVAQAEGAAVSEMAKNVVETSTEEKVTPKPTLFLLNKQDLPAAFGIEELLGPGAANAHWLSLSAADPASRSRLEDAILRCLGQTHLDPDAPLLANRRQLGCARRALQALQDASAAAALGLDAVGVCLQDALAALCELTGENAADTVVDEVFERFCVGK